MSQVTEQTAPRDVGREVPDELDRDRTRRRTRLWLGGLATLLVVTLPLATGLGPVDISPATVARIGGRITSIRLLLASVAVGYVLAAATSFMIFSSDSEQGARDVLFWLLGSLTLAVWSSVMIAGLLVVVAVAMLLLWARWLDALAIGDETARALGVSPTRVRTQLLVVVSLCVAAVVAVSGGIGFVGLVVPHVARLCVGGTHRRVLPAAAFIGAAFLIWADAFARVVLAPAELPLGIVTAIVGAPLLFILVRRFHASQP